MREVKDLNNQLVRAIERASKRAVPKELARSYYRRELVFVLARSDLSDLQRRNLTGAVEVARD